MYHHNRVSLLIKFQNVQATLKVECSSIILPRATIRLIEQQHTNNLSHVVFLCKLRDALNTFYIDKSFRSNPLTRKRGSPRMSESRLIERDDATTFRAPKMFTSMCFCIVVVSPLYFSIISPFNSSSYIRFINMYSYNLVCSCFNTARR